MSLITSENFLPGVLTEVESDYSFGYDSSQFGSTDSIVVIGTSFSGPVGTPVPVYSPEHARYVFGKAYDSKSKTEATLVAAIEDAYQQGGRTIYGVRVSGKQVEKTFEFALDTNLRLKVSSLVPTNQAKDYFMVYDDTTGDERIKLYKPAERATIVEKMQGRVNAGNSVIVTEIKLNRDYGMTKDNRITDVMNAINTHAYNNVLRLSIVDSNGKEVTESSEEALRMTLGAVYPGAYMIGRDKSKCVAKTEMNYNLIASDSDKPYESFEGKIYKTLKINTDVAMGLPIFAASMEELGNALKDAEVFMLKPFDFLETAGIADKAFEKDEEDYEEVRISNFEVYKRLGSGFAINARAEKRVSALDEELMPKIKEAPASDGNRTATITDGIYSMLENMDARYRVMVAGEADSVIADKLPRPKDFLVAAPKSVEILNGLVKATPKIEADDKTTAKAFSFKFKKLEDPINAKASDLVANTVISVVATVAKEDVAALNVESGTTILVSDAEKLTLKRSNGKTFEELTEKGLVGKMVLSGKKLFVGTLDVPTSKVKFVPMTEEQITFGVGKKFVILENGGRTYAGELIKTALEHIKPVGELEAILGENEDQTVVYAQFNYGEVNPIIISSASFEGTTLEEMVDYLNKNESLEPGFEFALTAKGAISKDDYVSDMITDFELAGGEIASDKETVYDYNKYVPYKTSDTFARQLAQHCTYTSLKTSPTHGMIGVSKISSASLDAIANKVDELVELELELYAKTQEGRNMLDRNGMPYSIGKNISVPVTQYQVTLLDGYRFISNGAGGYAGMVSDLPLDQSSTNQPIGIQNTSYRLTNYQLTKLTQKGYITLKDSFTRGLVVTDGITMASAESPFRRLSTTRVIGAIENLIREAVEPFIGKQNHAANRNSMQTAIKSQLEAVKDRLIEDYEFKMVVDPSVMKFSYVDIDYKIVPIYEIREVRNRISVKEEL